MSDESVARFLADVYAKDVDRHWRELTRVLLFYSAILGRVIAVPVGFRSDGRSIPRWIPLAFAIFGGKNSPAAWIHDWLYASGEVSRALADAIFREALRVEFADARAAVLAGRPPAATWWGRTLQEARAKTRVAFDAAGAGVMYAGVRAGGWMHYKRRPQPIPAAPVVLIDPSPGA